MVEFTLCLTSDWSGISSCPLCSWFSGFGSKQESASLALQPLNYITGFPGSPACRWTAEWDFSASIAKKSLSLFLSPPSFPSHQQFCFSGESSLIHTHVPNHPIPPLCPLLISICIICCEYLWFLYENTNINWSVCLFFFFFLINLFILFIYFWLHWALIAARGLSPVAASGGHSPLQCVGLSPRWPLLLRSTGCRHAGFSSCGTWAQ